MAYEEKIPLIDGLPRQFLCHIQYNKPGGSVSAHYHNYIEIIYCISGKNEVRLNDLCYSLNAGELLLINSRDVHSISFLEDGSYLVLRFFPELLYTSPQSTIDLKYILPFVLSDINKANIFSEKKLSGSNIPNLLFEIYEENQKKKYGYDIAVITKINAIFLWLLRYWHHKNSDIDIIATEYSGTANKMKKVFSYVEKNYENDITTEDMARLCNMSYSYFSRTFKKIMKKSFSEYLNYIRISEAEKLLVTSDMNITEIAMEVGFSSSSYFIQQFKNLRNISPKQYRKNYETTAKAELPT